MDKLTFRDISMEIRRTYIFPGGIKVTIEDPESLHVSQNNTHRIVDAAGNSHIVPTGWVHLMFTVKAGFPPFSF